MYILSKTSYPFSLSLKIFERITPSLSKKNILITSLAVSIFTFMASYCIYRWKYRNNKILLNGYHKISYKNMRYAGIFNNGLMTEGKIFEKNNKQDAIHLIGSFNICNGKLSGKGQCIIPAAISLAGEETKVNGTFQQGLLEGQGEFSFKFRSFTGLFHKGLLIEGRHIVRSKINKTEEVCLLKGNFDVSHKALTGEGIYEKEDKSICVTGKFQNDNPVGNMIMKVNKCIYEGIFTSDEKALFSKGKFINEEGQLWLLEGEFFPEERICGQGTVIYADGKKVVGTFKNGHLIKADKA